MEKITIHTRTNKKSGKIRLRFRLRDGREVQLYHKSNIVVSIDDLRKFNGDGSLRARVSVFNKELQSDILSEIDLIHNAYNKMKDAGVPLTSSELEKTINGILHPTCVCEKTMLSRFADFIDRGYRDGLFGLVRKKNYMVVYRIVERFLIIMGMLDIRSEDFDSSLLMDLDIFIRDEYKYVSEWPGLYTSLRLNDVPRKIRSSNTVATKMKYVHAFFRELEEREEIVKSPFLRLGRERKCMMLRERYGAPIYLYLHEFRKILEKDVPKELQEVKDAFCLQCALGCRIGDFRVLTMEKVGVMDGIPYVHYLPHKTLRENDKFVEIETPLVKFAWDIIQAYKFDFPILRYASGKSGYNVKIKQLLKFCEIDRRCVVFDESIGDNTYIPLYMIASSKICRKTHVDIMNKVQVNQYVAGLHREGSDAIHRYTKLEFKDRFELMCVAFHEPLYNI